MTTELSLLLANTFAQLVGAMAQIMMALRMKS